MIPKAKVLKAWRKISLRLQTELKRIKEQDPKLYEHLNLSPQDQKENAR